MAGFLSNHFGSGRYKSPTATCKHSRGIVHVEVLASRPGQLVPNKPVAGVTATVTGPDNPAAQATEGSGRRAFGPLHLGNYNAAVAFPPPLDEKYDVPGMVPPAMPLPLAAGAVTLFTFRVHWHWIEFQVRDSQNRAVPRLDFRLFHRPPAGLVWTKIEDGVTPINGNVLREEVKRGRYKLRIAALANAAWSSPTLEIGTAITLTADATGFDAGETGEFQILDAFDHAKPLETVAGTMIAGGPGLQLRAAWTPPEATFKKLEHSQVLFRALAGKAQAVSPRRTLLRTETLNLDHADGQPIDTQITLHFSGGTNWTAPALPGGTAQAKIPWGERVVRIEMPHLHDSRVRMEEADKLLAFQ